MFVTSSWWNEHLNEVFKVRAIAAPHQTPWSRSRSAAIRSRERAAFAAIPELS